MTITSTVRIHSTGHWCGRVLRAIAACVAVGCLAATSGEAAAPAAPHVVALVEAAAGPRLMPLDARTLEPRRGGWSRTIAKGAAAALSPSGARVAITARGDRVLLLDGTTGRVVRRIGEAGSEEQIYWLGGDGTAGTRPELLVGVTFGCWSLGCGNEYTIVGSGGSSGYEGEPETVAALREGLAFAYVPTKVYVYGPDYGLGNDIDIELPRMPTSAPFQLVADVAHSRLFAVSSAGMVAEIDRFGDLRRKPRVRYHRVALNGRPFAATWAGAGKLALWGKDGLGTIDTRTWSTQAIAPGVTGAVATPFGLATWTADPADGLTVYRPDGRRRLRVLAGKRIHTTVAVGGYLYADVADDRYSVDLRTGKVTGPLSRDARILAPDLVAIP